ncbi:MAG: universal stress protein [Gemmatimonadota bacterium]|nr:MAG: universal stress protein [Gemmatimonadota bacterium]
MITIKKILFPTDFSECANQALCHATYLAQKFNSELIMLHAFIMYEDDPNDPDHRFPDLCECYDSMEAVAETRMDRCVDEETKGKIKVTKVNVRAISPSTEIIEYARENEVDLIIMGTHGRTAVSHFLLGSVAEKVVRSAPCPVLTVGPEHGADTDAMVYERILVPVDFSDPCKNAMRYAVTLGKLYNAHLDLLHVIEGWIHPAFYTTWDKSILDFMPDIKTRAMEAMEDFIKNFDVDGLTFDKNVAEGKAHTQIVDFAEERKANLIVIATRGLGAIDHFLLGNTAEKVVRKSPCPVLSVKTPEHEFITE